MQSLSNIADFVSGDAAAVIAFLFTNEFAFEGALAARNIRAGDEYEDIQVM